MTIMAKAAGVCEWTLHEGVIGQPKYQILKIPTREATSWSPDQKVEDGSSAATEKRPSTHAVPLPSLTALKKKLHMCGGVVHAHGQTQQNSSTALSETRSTPAGNDDILAKVRGLLKCVPGSAHSKRQHEANIDAPPTKASGNKQPSVKHADDTVNTESGQDSYVTGGDRFSGDRLTVRSGSDVLPCRSPGGLSLPVSVHGMSHSINTTPAPIVNTTSAAIVNTTPAPIVNTTSAAIVNTTPTAIVNTTLTTIVNTTPVAIVNATTTAIVNTTPTAVINNMAAAIVNTTPAVIVNATPAAIVNTTPTAIVNTTPTAIINTPPTTIVNTPATAIVNTTPTAIVNTTPAAIVNTTSTTIINTTPATTVSITPAVLVSAADLSSDSSVSGTDLHGPCCASRNSQNAPVRKPRKRKPNKVRYDNEETAPASPIQRSECPVVAVTPCRPVDNSPEKMHPEILCRLRTDLQLARHQAPVVIPLYPVEPVVTEEQPLDLSKTVWPSMLPLDLSTKATALRVSRPDMTIATATFTNSQPRPPALGTRTMPQKISPVRPVQRQPVSRTAPSDRVATAAKAGFRDGTVLHEFLSQRVRTAVDKLQLGNGLDRRDMPTPLRRVSAESPADSPCRVPSGKSNGELTVAACPVDAGVSGSQRISRIASLLAQRLGCSVYATKPRSSLSNVPSPASTQHRTESDGTFQSRFIAPRRKSHNVKPPLAEVRPISASPRSRSPDTALRPAYWSDDQQRASHNVGLAVVEPSKHCLTLAGAGDGTGQIGNGQLSTQLGSKSGTRTYNISVSRPVVRSSMISHDVITIIDTSPVLTSKTSSANDVLAAWKLSDTRHTSEASATDVSQELPVLSPPKLHIVSPPAVAGSNVCNTAATTQMPQLSPHADVTAVGPTDSGSRRSDGPAVRRSLSPPPLLVYGSADGPFPGTDNTASVSSTFKKSKAAMQRRAVAAANPNIDLAVFMPTKPFSINLFSRCDDTWEEDIARPSKAGGSVRHRSTFDIGRTTYYKNTILCQQTAGTTSQIERRPGGRYPVAVASSSRHADDAATHEMCRQYHRDCRLPASIISALPTLPAGYDYTNERRSPKMARTVASVKRAVTANMEAANPGLSPAKMGRMCHKKSLLSSNNNVHVNVSPKMARTVASVRQELRASHSAKTVLGGIAHRRSSTIGQLKSSERPEQELNSDSHLSTGADLSDPELNCSSARFGYARKAFGSLETDSTASHVQNVETSPKKGSGTKHIAVSPRNEPVVNHYTNGNARSGKSPSRRRNGDKPKTVLPAKTCSNKSLTPTKLLTHAEFPQLNAHAVEKAVVALFQLPSTGQKQEPHDSGPISKKGRLSPRDDRGHVSVTFTPSPLFSDAISIDGEASHRDTMSSTATRPSGENRSQAAARTFSKITLRHSYPVVKLKRVEAGPDQTMTWKCVSKQSPGAEQRRSSVRTSTRISAGKPTENFASPKGDSVTRTSSSSGSNSVRSRLRRPPTDRRISSSSSSSSSCGSQHRKRRSLLDELSNTDGYIADETRRRAGVDLFADSSTLSREERALQRAMIKFTEMEMGLGRKGKSSTKPKKEEKRRTSERNNAIGRCSWKRYHKDRAYELELYRERQRRQRILERRQARLLSNEKAGRDDSQPSPTVGRNEPVVVSAAKPKRSTFSWSSPYWKGSRSRALKKKLYGCQSRKVQSHVSSQPQVVIETEATVPTYYSADDQLPELLTESHELISENRCDVDSATKSGPSSQDGDRVLTIPADVKKLGVCRDVGETVLHRAARLGYREIALWCCQTRYVDVNIPDNAGFTPLHETCIGGHVAIAKTLLAYGADINVASRLNGVRPIHDAVEHDQVEMVRLLLSCGADTSLSTYSGSTLFAIAHSKEMKQFLHGYFTDLNGSGKQQSSILTTSWEFDRYRLTKLADGDEQDDEEEGTGFDVFDHLPSEETESAGDIQLEFSDRPHIPTYNISFSRKEGSRNYVLLRDVLDHLNINRASFMKTGGDEFQLRRLSMAKFLYLTQHCQNLECRYNDDANSHVELVEWNNALRVRLGVEVVTFRDGVVLGGNGGEVGDVVQDDTDCSSRSLQSPLQGEIQDDVALLPVPICIKRVPVVTSVAAPVITSVAVACADELPNFPDEVPYEYNFDVFDEMALMQQSYAVNTDVNVTSQAVRRNNVSTEPEDTLSNVYGPATRIRIENGQVRVLCDNNGRRRSPRICLGPDIASSDAQATGVADWAWPNSVACATPSALSAYMGTRVIGVDTSGRIDMTTIVSQSVDMHGNSALLAEKYPHYTSQSLPEADKQSLACCETDVTSGDDGECMLKIANVCTLRGSKAMQVFAPDSPAYTAALPP